MNTSVEETELEEHLISEEKLINDVLHRSFDEYTRYRKHVTGGLYLSESVFLKRLGFLLKISSHRDAVRILHSWQRQCTQAAMEYRIWEAKEKAKNSI